MGETVTEGERDGHARVLKLKDALFNHWLFFKFNAWTNINFDYKVKYQTPLQG